MHSSSLSQPGAHISDSVAQLSTVTTGNLSDIAQLPLETQMVLTSFYSVVLSKDCKEFPSQLRWTHF